MKVLYVDATVRENSRTKILADHLVGKFKDAEIDHLILRDENLQVLSREKLQKRNELLEKGAYDDPMFEYARNFRDADIIVMAAPYWDLGMPAYLKMYIEVINNVGITFAYDENEKSYGLCKARKLYYVSTMGGKDLPYTYGFEYVKALCENFYDIKELKHFKAEGLDLLGADPQAIMAKALKEIDEYFA